MQEQKVTEPYLTPKALALRWNITRHTLNQWRWRGHGPHFFKLGSCIRYLEKEIERFEAYTPQITIANPKDERFLRINLGSLPSKQTEEIAMDP